MVELKNCRIGTKICVVVDIDHMIMIVVTKRQKDKNTKIQKDKRTKKTKRQNDKKDKNTKIQKDKRTKKDKKTKRQKRQKDKKDTGIANKWFRNYLSQ